VGALSQITTYTEFERAVLNAKDMVSVTDSLSTMLRLLGEELEEAS